MHNIDDSLSFRFMNENRRRAFKNLRNTKYVHLLQEDLTRSHSHIPQLEIMVINLKISRSLKVIFTHTIRLAAMDRYAKSRRPVAHVYTHL